MSALIRLGGDGPPVVLLAGFGADSLSWTATAPALIKQCEIWALDLPGHGKAAAIENDGSVTALADYVVDKLSARFDAPLRLVGHSLGGTVAIHVAASQALAVRSLAVIAPPGLGESVNHAFLDALPQVDDADSATIMLQSLVADPRLISSQLGELLLRQLSRPGVREQLMRVAEHIKQVADTIETPLARIIKQDLPRLTVWGDTDGINPIDRQRLQSFGGEQHVYTACGHLPHIEKRVSLNRVLSAFLAL